MKVNNSMKEEKHRNGKGSVYRISVTDKKYKENYNKIFRKEKNEQRLD